jgi:hypothetical protein
MVSFPRRVVKSWIKDLISGAERSFNGGYDESRDAVFLRGRRFGNLTLRMFKDEGFVRIFREGEDFIPEGCYEIDLDRYFESMARGYKKSLRRKA